MVNEKTINFRIEPYIKEAVLQVIVDIIVLSTTIIVLTLADFPTIICVSVGIGYFVLILLFHYRVPIQAIIDKRKKDCVIETVTIKQFMNEHSFAGDRTGHSNIRFFYPKEMQVDKYKINVQSLSGEKFKLRSVMSFRRSIEFAVLEKQNIEHLKVTYLKRSKILVNVELVQSTNTIISKQKKIVEKALHCINVSI